LDQPPRMPEDLIEEIRTSQESNVATRLPRDPLQCAAQERR
jgi:hypothetical protein